MMHSINDKTNTNHNTNASGNYKPVFAEQPTSALSHFENFQDRKLKKIHMNFSNSIKQVESTMAAEAAQSVDIQNKIIQIRSIGSNIERNIF